MTTRNKRLDVIVAYLFPPKYIKKIILFLIQTNITMIINITMLIRTFRFYIYSIFLISIL